MEILELESIITKIKKYWMGLIQEWRWQRKESVKKTTNKYFLKELVNIKNRTIKFTQNEQKQNDWKIMNRDLVSCGARTKDQISMSSQSQKEKIKKMAFKKYF